MTNRKRTTGQTTRKYCNSNSKWSIPVLHDLSYDYCHTRSLERQMCLKRNVNILAICVQAVYDSVLSEENSITPNTPKED